MKNPLVSWVCVTYDRPELLNELLYCFLMQDYKNSELVILNDQENINYVYDDEKVRIFNLKERFESLGAKREYTKRLVKGDYVFITDDDDIYYTNHTSRLLKFHREHPEYDIVANKMSHHSQDNGKIIYGCPLAFNGASIKRDYYLNNVFPDNVSCGEDYIFVKNAKTGYIGDKNENTSWHYRWGLNIWHMSGMGGDGQESYENVTNKSFQYTEVTKRTEEDYKQRTIKLKPQISDAVKKYYR